MSVVLIIYKEIWEIDVEPCLDSTTKTQQTLTSSFTLCWSRLGRVTVPVSDQDWREEVLMTSPLVAAEAHLRLALNTDGLPRDKSSTPLSQVNRRHTQNIYRQHQVNGEPSFNSY